MKQETPDQPIDLSSALLLEGKSLSVQHERYVGATEKKFSSLKELQELVITNHTVFFNEDTVLIDATKSAFTGFYLFDFVSGVPKLYALHFSLHEKNFMDIFASVSKMLASLTVDEQSKELGKVLNEIITADKALAKTFKEYSEDGAQHIIEQGLFYRPDILLINDAPRKELADWKKLYTEWNTTVKEIAVKKYDDNGIQYVLQLPLFADIDLKPGKKKKNGSGEKVVRNTEEDHLRVTDSDVEKAYKHIKAEMMKFDNTLSFNVQNYYIALSNGTNRGMFKFTMKKMEIVVKLPFAEVQKMVPNHDIKEHTESVQGFYGGVSCSIFIWKNDKLDEVIKLLKKLVKP